MSDRDLTDERIVEMRARFEPSCDCEMGDGEECDECRPWQTFCALIDRCGGAFVEASVVKRMEATVERLRRQRDELQDGRVVWSRCPVCGGLVAMTGIPCLVGTCRKCDYITLESEMEPVDPAAEVERMRRLLAAYRVLRHASGGGGYIRADGTMVAVRGYDAVSAGAADRLIIDLEAGREPGSDALVIP